MLKDWREPVNGAQSAAQRLGCLNKKTAPHAVYFVPDDLRQQIDTEREVIIDIEDTSDTNTFQVFFESPKTGLSHTLEDNDIVNAKNVISVELTLRTKTS